MGKKRRNITSDSLLTTVSAVNEYLDIFTEMAITSIKWNDLPSTIDARYLELVEFQTGKTIFFQDIDADMFLCLSMAFQGNFDVYGNPKKRRAYSRYNQYSNYLTDKNSVIIWNNYSRKPSYPRIYTYAKRLALLDVIIDINVNAQKTPVLLRGSEKQRLTLENLYMQYAGNYPFLFGSDDLQLDSLNVLKTDAPYVGDKLYSLKIQIWNEALTYLGISNVSFQKKERLVSDEVSRNMGGTVANRNSRLDARKKACDDINKMFGLNVSVEWNDQYDIKAESYIEEQGVSEYE